MPTGQFFWGIVSGAILSVFGHWVAQVWWLKQQEWTSKRDTYMDILEKLARFFILTRQIRSSYLALDEEGVNDKLRERDPLIVDVSALTVRSSFIIKDDEVVQALMNVEAAQPNVSAQVNSKLSSANSLKEQAEVMAWGLEQQANAAAASMRTVRNVAERDLRLKKGTLTLHLTSLTNWLARDEDVIQLKLNAKSSVRNS